MVTVFCQFCSLVADNKRDPEAVSEEPGTTPHALQLVNQPY